MMVVILSILFLLVFLFISTFSGEVVQNDKIKIIPLKGIITSTGSDGGILSEKGASADSLIKEIKKADNDPSIKAIIFEINSPGGTVVGTKEIANSIEKSEKPTVAWIREIGTSGAYWVSSSCDYIVADSMSLTGSIGVSSSYIDFAGLMDGYGVNYNRLIAGEYKDIGSPYKNMSSGEREFLENQLDTVHKMFIAKIAENRGLEYTEVKKYANGAPILGINAYEYELVDEWQIIIQRGESMIDELIVNVSPRKFRKLNNQKFIEGLANYIKENLEISPNTINIMSSDEISRSLGMESQLKEKRILDIRPKY